MLVGINNNIALNISDLNISFDIIRNFKIEDNTADFSVYNAKKETRDNILTKDNNIIFKAGYEDEGEMGQIFSGIINESSNRKNGTEWITEIVASDFGNNTENLLKEVVDFSYEAGTSLTSVVNDIVGILSIPVTGLDNISSIELNNGFVSNGGYIKQVIKKIENIMKANEVGLYFDNSEMVIYNLGQKESEFGVIKITENSGLVGEVEEINDDKEEEGKKRIAFTSLLNNKIKPNILMKVATQKVNGLYITEQVNFVGDNFGGDFFAIVEAVD